MEEDLCVGTEASEACMGDGATRATRTREDDAAREAERFVPQLWKCIHPVLTMDSNEFQC